MNKAATIANSISTTTNKPRNEWKLMQKVLKSSINGIFYKEFDTTASTISPLYIKSYNVTIFLKSHYIRKLIRRKYRDRSTQHSFAIFRWKALFPHKKLCIENIFVSPMSAYVCSVHRNSLNLCAMMWCEKLFVGCTSTGTFLFLFGIAWRSSHYSNEKSLFLNSIIRLCIVGKPEVVWARTCTLYLYILQAYMKLKIHCVTRTLVW